VTVRARPPRGNTRARSVAVVRVVAPPDERPKAGRRSLGVRGGAPGLSRLGACLTVSRRRP